MERCEKCIHYAACHSWSNHGRFLTEDCPFFSDRELGQYIKLEDLQKFPIREDHCDKEHGNEHFIYGVETVLEYAEYLPTYDVVPKSEVERLQKALDEYEETSGLKQAKAEVAREIFEEIESLLKRTCEKGYCGSISDLFAELKKKYAEGD